MECGSSFATLNGNSCAENIASVLFAVSTIGIV